MDYTHVAALLAVVAVIVGGTLYHVHRSSKALDLKYEAIDSLRDAEIKRSNFWRRYHNPKNGTWVL